MKKICEDMNVKDLREQLFKEDPEFRKYYYSWLGYSQRRSGRFWEKVWDLEFIFKHIIHYPSWILWRKRRFRKENGKV